MEPLSIFIGTLLFAYIFSALFQRCPKVLMITIEVETKTSWYPVESMCIFNPFIVMRVRQLKTFGYVVRLKR